MLDLTNPAIIRALLSKHGLRPKKALGQNFIVSPHICPKIADAGGARAGVGALEIGPGLGVLTAELAKRCDKVVAVELDKGLLPLLDETLRGFDNITVVHGDILKLELKSFLRENFGDMPVIVCANLPYYITTPILMALLEAKLPISSVTVMMQKETAQRVCAPLPSRQAGAITVAIAWYTSPELLFSVPRGSFLPPPDVDSAVVRLTMRDEHPVPVRSEEALMRVIRAAFAQRRKTLLNCLSSAMALPKEETRRLLEGAGVDPGARAEQLDLAAFARIANEL